MAPEGEERAAGERAHSGRLLLRMPRPLHARLAARSERDGISLNQWIVDALERASAGEEPAAEARRPLRGVPRELRLVLIANAVVVAISAVVAVTLIVFAWR